MEKSEKLSVKVYRHKEEKNVFLVRNWGLCGGSVDSEFYKTTTDLIEAIRNVAGRQDFENWMNSFNGELYVKHKKKLDVEIDGYTGTLEKEIKLYVRDFEKVTLTEN